MWANYEYAASRPTASLALVFFYRYLYSRGTVTVSYNRARKHNVRELNRMER